MPAGTWPATVAPPRARVSSDPRGLEVVYRALFILEANVRQLSLDVWRSGALAAPASLPSVLRRPSLDMSASAFNGETVQSLGQRGNAYWRLVRNGPHAENILNVEILDPLLVSAYRDTRGHLVYEYDGKRVPTADIVHLKLTHQPGEVLGLGPIQACMDTVNNALALRELADNWTTGPGTARGILSTDQDLSADQAERYATAAREKITAANGIAVLGKGLSYSPLKLTPAEVQYLESQEADALKLARMFGLSQRQAMAAIKGSSMTYANIESEKALYLTDTFMAYVRELEDAYTRIAPIGNVCRFNVDAFLRPDTLTRYQAHEIGTRAGFLTVNEVRAIEGLPAIEEVNDND